MVISVGTVSSMHALSNSHAYYLVVDLPTCCFFGFDKQHVCGVYCWQIDSLYLRHSKMFHLEYLVRILSGRVLITGKLEKGSDAPKCTTTRK